MNAYLTTADGLKLQVRHWYCVGPKRGTMLIVHGLGEHIGRYAHVVARLISWGWDVVGYDQRGHGRSDGAKGCLNHADDLMRDLALVIDAARSEHPGPLMLLGHSMGGLVAARFVAEGVQAQAQQKDWYRSVDALVLSSPALAVSLNPLQKLMLVALGPWLPNLAINNGLQSNWVSRDPKVVAAYKVDPLVHDRISPRLARFIVDGGETVRQRAAAWNVPTLLLYSGGDRCVAPAGSRAFAAAAPGALTTARAFDLLFHEIFNEPEQDQVLEALGVWLTAWDEKGAMDRGRNELGKPVDALVAAELSCSANDGVWRIGPQEQRAWAE